MTAIAWGKSFSSKRKILSDGWKLFELKIARGGIREKTASVYDHGIESPITRFIGYNTY